MVGGSPASGHTLSIQSTHSKNKRCHCHEAMHPKQADLAMEAGARELGHVAEDIVLKHERAITELPVGERRIMVLQAPLLA